jgi:hypothetical protein
MTSPEHDTACGRQTRLDIQDTVIQDTVTQDNMTIGAVTM